MDYSSLDKNSSEQLFLQIRRMVLRSIRGQELLPRQRMPSVNELSQNLGVSRMTVRQALQTLIQEGWLYTVPGKGTFVAERPYIEQNLQQLKGWTEEIRAQGKQPSTRIIGVESVPADRTTARYLNISLSDRVYRILRVRFADDFPLTVEKAFLVVNRFPGLDQLIQQPQASLYGILRQTFSVNPTRAVQFLEAGEADQPTADLLGLNTGSPVLITERITYAAGSDPLEYVFSLARPGFVRYKTELSAGSAAAWQIIMPSENNEDGSRTRLA
jgi:GntR family transcriptional regulator